MRKIYAVNWQKCWSREGYTVLKAADGQAAYELLQQQPVQLVRFRFKNAQK
jgi:DNA-binding response OmpR family regulator